MEKKIDESLKQTFDRLHNDDPKMQRFFRICKQYHRERLTVMIALSTEYLKVHEAEVKSLNNLVWKLRQESTKWWGAGILLGFIIGFLFGIIFNR